MTAVSFSYAPDPEDCSIIIITAHAGGKTAGSVAVQEHSSRQVSIGRLNTRPGFRKQGIARQLMEHVLGMFPRASKLLFADPYVPEEGWPEGPPCQVLEDFYASLGFELTAGPDGRRLMVRQPD